MKRHLPAQLYSLSGARAATSVLPQRSRPCTKRSMGFAWPSVLLYLTQHARLCGRKLETAGPTEARLEGASDDRRQPGSL